MSYTEKTLTTSFLHTQFFGPLGVFYSSILSGIILFVLAIVLIPTIIGPFIFWVLAIVIGDHCTHKHNCNIRKFMQG
jgi:hypothetical protein